MAVEHEHRIMQFEVNSNIVGEAIQRAISSKFRDLTNPQNLMSIIWIHFQSDCHLLHEINWPLFLLVVRLFSMHFIAKCILVPFPAALFCLFAYFAYSIWFGSIRFVCCINNFAALLNYKMHTLENKHLNLYIFNIFSVPTSK